MLAPVQTILLTLLALPLVVLGFGPAVHADTIYVCWDGSGDYLTIQEGIDAAQDGDEVVVCDGTYTGSGNRDVYFRGKAITVRSQSGDPEACVVDCENAGRGFNFWNSEGPSAVLSDLTIKRASGSGYAGAIYCDESSPTIINCHFIDNSANFGAAIYSSGIYEQHNHPTLIDCSFSGGSAGTGGGALACGYSSPVLINCDFHDNSARYGGGMYCNYSSPTVVQCTFTSNSVHTDGKGGAVHLHAPYGTGPKLSHCTFIDNSATGSMGLGGAIDFYDGVLATINNCLFAGNSATLGGAVFVRSCGPDIVGCTLSANTAVSSGGGIYVEMSGNPVISNGILWDNSDAGGTDESAQIHIADGSAAVNYTCVQGWTGGMGGVGNIGNDPLFVDADGPDGVPGTEDDNLRLSAASPCIDAGDTTAVAQPADRVVFGDRDGCARVLDDPAIADTGVPGGLLSQVVDMGAYECKYRIPGDINGDGCVDQSDLGILLAHWGAGCP